MANAKPARTASRAGWRQRAALALAVALFAPVGWTAENGLFRTGVVADRTSDVFDRHELFFDYRNHRREFFWPWEEAETHDLDWGVNARRMRGSTITDRFDGTRVLGTLGKRFSPAVYLETSAGGHQLRVHGQGEKTLTIYSASAYLKPIDALSVHLETDKDFVYQEDVLPAGISAKLDARTTRLGLTWRPVNRLRILGQSRYRTFSDNNASHHNIFSALYGISPDWPWIWAGVGGEELEFDDQKTSYWSPKKFTAYGPRLDSSFPITQRLNGSAAINLDRLNEDGSHGNGGYFALGLEVRVSRTLYLKLDASHIKSVQRGSSWTGDTYSLSLAGALP